MSTIHASMRSLVGCMALLAGLLAAPALHAQGAGPGAGGPGAGGGRGAGQMGTPEERATAQLTQLTTLLTLTPDQVTKVRPVLVKQFTDQQGMMGGGQAGGDMAARRTQMLEITTKAQTDILALLTDAQKPIYQRFLEEEAARRPAGMGGGRGAGGPGGQAGGAPPQQ